MCCFVCCSGLPVPYFLTRGSGLCGSVCVRAHSDESGIPLLILDAESHEQDSARGTSTGLQDSGSASYVSVCEREVSSLCPSGWAFYSDADASEGMQSCVWLSSATVTSWTSANTSCPSGGHLLTVTSSVATSGLLAFAATLISNSTSSFIGCSQSASATQRGSGWTWVDGTNASNLDCGTGIGCGLWTSTEPE